MKTNKIPQFIGRLITAIVLLGITAFFTPGFTASSIFVIVVAIFLLTLFDFFISSFTKIFSHPLIKGIIGFVLCAITLYLVQYIINGYTISWISALLGALVYAIVDYMLPSDENSNVHTHSALA